MNDTSSNTRRDLLRLGLAFLFPAAERAGPQEETAACQYTANATILLFGLPAFTRRGVGGGFGRVRRSAGTLELEFAAGSKPETAAGLNRLGYIRETIPGMPGPQHPATIFGFITASNPETLDQARQTLKRDDNSSQFTVMETVIGDGTAVSRITQLPGSSSVRWPTWTNAEPEFRRAFASATFHEHRLTFDSSGAPPTFLAAIQQAMRKRQPRGEARYAWNGRLYGLRWQSRPDGPLHRLDAQVQNPLTRKTTAFQLWFDPSESVPLPHRISYAPRVFLRLVFERTRS